MKRPSLDFILVYAITLFLAVIVVLPVIVVVLGSCLNTSFLGISSEQWVAGSSGLLTFKWYGYVWGLYRTSMAFSLEIAILSVA
ncbi:MAG: hypothetical protein JO102_02385, partial [Elusimicrobia bacterium]|nr:hypothetical protein [Elusimicrobiota bacterium]